MDTNINIYVISSTRATRKKRKQSQRTEAYRMGINAKKAAFPKQLFFKITKNLFIN